MSSTNSEKLSPIKQALLELRELRTQLEAVENRQHEPIAILGAGLRFPGDAHDLDSFWHVLKEGVDTISEVPPERWDIESFYDSNPETPGKMSTRYGGFLKDVDQFDAAFFNISPREAISLDPQQRLLLEVSWEALENAGVPAEGLFGSPTGVFLGVNNSDYFRLLIAEHEKIDTYATTGTALSVAGGRLSYYLGINGPSLSIDTACSSSLVSVHLAMQSLRRGECNLALAGGVSLLLTPELTINFSKANMMAPDGRCKTFDARADGYVRSEGCAMIVLKRLSDALEAGDHILAVLRGSAVNHDGRSSGLTAPNGPSQEAVIASALDDANLAANEIDYIEAHGTGTSLGDPIEVGALLNALCQGRSADQSLYLGSVKTNLGHTEAAAGVAGLLKAILMLQKEQIPPNLHFQTWNPHIAEAQKYIQVPTSLIPWPGKHYLGVSSFGLSGTNAHVILESAPSTAAVSQTVERKSHRPLHLMTLSARSESAIRKLAARFDRYLATHTVELADIAYSANTGRSHLSYRLALTAADIAALAQKLSAVSSGENAKNTWLGQLTVSDQPPVVFLFTGYGTHYFNMGRQLYESQPVFRQVIDTCDELLRSVLPQSLVSVMYPDESVEGSLDNMTYGQPAMFALQIALAELWKSWGIQPTAVAGHSVGEYAAACIAGVLSLEDALKLVAQRGDQMQALPEDGEMVTVFAGEDRVAPIIAPFIKQVSIAAINSPETVVISGQRDAVLEAVAVLKAEKIRTRLLNVPRAAHSPMVEPMIPAIAETSAKIAFQRPQVEFFSTVTGGSISTELTRPEYWQRHLRQTVRFAEATAALYEAGYRTFLEIGPNPTLISLGQRSIPEQETTLWVPSLREGWTDWDQMLEALGRLYVNGAIVDWETFERQDGPRHKLPLPTYPWERKSYWWSGITPGSYAVAAPWKQAIRASRRQSQQVPVDMQISEFPAKWEALNRLATIYIANALVELGAFQQSGERHNSNTLIEKYHIQPVYRALLSRWLKLLAEAGILGLEAEHYSNQAALQLQPVDELLNNVRRELEEIPALPDYMQESGERLAAMLIGEESPLEIMFPGGSKSRAEELYQNWAHARYFHNLTGAVTEAIVNATPGKSLRLLEIGAGIGSTTYGVLPMLPAERVIYHFTDISDLFLNFAREKFSAYPFVHYGLFDVEKDSLEQGYGRGQFNIILAGNVIHATSSLSETLANVRNLLAPDGVLILFEATTHQPWYDVTISLIEGWQSFTDDLRQESPLLSADQWTGILQAAGFMEVAVFPEQGSAAEILGEHVILAKSPSQGTSLQDIDFALEALPPDRDSAIFQQERKGEDLRQRLAVALPEERKEMLIDFVRSHVMLVLRLDPDEAPDRKARLMDLGIDSLMAVELRGHLSSGLKLERKLPATLIFDYPTIEAITEHLLQEVLIFEEQSDEDRVPPSPDAAIADLSDDEIEAMLLKKLNNLK